MPAVLFGSISTVADTSELQRRAFNEAFEAHHLTWVWEREEYAAMLAESGGRSRIAAYAAARDERVDDETIHKSKTEAFQRLLATEEVVPRAGVIDTIWQARNAGCKIAFVTTTSADNVAAVLAALRHTHDMPGFDAIVDGSQVSRTKPDREAYVTAMRLMRQRNTRCVAIEDNKDGVAAAVAAGLPCVVFPNDNTVGHEFDQATFRVERLDFAKLRKFTDPG